MINEFKKGQEIETLSISSVPSNTLSFYLSQFYNANKQEKDIQLDFFETNVQNVIRRVHARKSELGFVYISKYLLLKTIIYMYYYFVILY